MHTQLTQLQSNFVVIFVKHFVCQQGAILFK